LVAGRAILAWSVRPFLNHPEIARVRVVIHADDAARYAEAVTDHAKLGPPIVGGDSRQESVRRGLEALEGEPPALVLIHDAARPLVSSEVIGRVVAGLGDGQAVLPTLPVAETLKRVEGAIVSATVPRDRIHTAQTPQGFHFEAILTAHRQAAAVTYTDDAGIAEAAGIEVKWVAGDPANFKVTTAGDIERLQQMVSTRETRTGIGYDVHAFGDGDHVVLGGVRIPHERSLAGHSDADVVLHAVTDALLGAIADKDIGAHFSPSDPSLSGAASDRFLSFACDRLRQRDGAIANLDVTVIAEAPAIGPHRDAMRARVAEICGIDVDRVAIKATTKERLGSIGRGEGLAALATATIHLPFKAT
jgi:2-C-methyl-D-erythritol 4-phosphate cytidylyltransferase/2-C-methyl-D-erythritol 2,4-cyclodiphosphate synthase